MYNKTGEVSWTDTIVGGNKGKNSGKDTFLRLNPGSNIVRLLTLPHQYHQHKYIVPGGKKYGYRFNCSAANGSCPICEKGDRAKRRWFVGVIERKTNTYKILDIGPSIFRAIQAYAKDNDWGDPSRYDLDIVVDPNADAVGYYTVVCKPLKPLSASDLVLQQENPVDELIRRTTPPSPEKVQERLDNVLKEIAGGNGSSEESDEDTSEDANASGDDDYFKDFDAKAKKSAF